MKKQRALKPLPKNRLSKRVGSGTLVRPWAWVWERDVESEVWCPGGGSRAECIRTARKAGYKRFVIAECRPVTRKDVREWAGDHDLRVGDWMVGDDREDFPKTKRRTKRPNIVTKEDGAENLELKHDIAALVRDGDLLAMSKKAEQFIAKIAP